MVFVWAGPEMRPPWFSPLPRPWPQPTRMSPQGCRWAPGAPPALFLLKLCSGSVSTPSCSSWRATASPTGVFWGRSGQVSALSQLWPQRPLTWHRPCPCVHPPPQNHDLQPSSLHDFPRIPLPPVPLPGCLVSQQWLRGPCPRSAWWAEVPPPGAWPAHWALSTHTCLPSLSRALGGVGSLFLGGGLTLFSLQPRPG